MEIFVMGGSKMSTKIVIMHVKKTIVVLLTIRFRKIVLKCSLFQILSSPILLECVDSALEEIIVTQMRILKYTIIETNNGLLH